MLGDLSSARNILVINDEAHHAWRKPAGYKGKIEKEEEEMATVWINGLDRIHRTRGILIFYDFTATPFAPTGHTSPEDTLYGWIINDFNLNDAIESGLVKTPRIVCARVRAHPLGKVQENSLLFVPIPRSFQIALLPLSICKPVPIGC